MAYLSLDAYGEAVLFNGAVFLTRLSPASHVEPPLPAADRGQPEASSRAGRLAGLYVFVAIQMGWVLRPFVGDPDQPTRFFRAGAWSNAYVEIAQLVWRVVGRQHPAYGSGGLISEEVSTANFL